MDSNLNLTDGSPTSLLSDYEQSPIDLSSLYELQTSVQPSTATAECSTQDSHQIPCLEGKDPLQTSSITMNGITSPSATPYLASPVKSFSSKLDISADIFNQYRDPKPSPLKEDDFSAFPSMAPPALSSKLLITDEEFEQFLNMSNEQPLPSPPSSTIDGVSPTSPSTTPQSTVTSISQGIDLSSPAFSNEIGTTANVHDTTAITETCPGQASAITALQASGIEIDDLCSVFKIKAQCSEVNAFKAKLQEAVKARDVNLVKKLMEEFQGKKKIDLGKMLNDIAINAFINNLTDDAL